MNFDSDFNSSANGYSLQLNCYSTEGPDITTEWQQYVIRAAAGGTEVFAMIDTWSGTQLTDELNRIQVSLASLPSPTIPAGYTFTIALTYDGNHNVTGAVYNVINAGGKSAGSTTLTIVGQTLRTTGNPATTANLAPIAAFQFDIGGVGGGEQATLTEGAGTVTYNAAETLTVVNAKARPSPISTTARRRAPTSPSARCPRPRARKCPRGSWSRLCQRRFATSCQAAARCRRSDLIRRP